MIFRIDYINYHIAALLHLNQDIKHPIPAIIYSDNYRLNTIPAIIYPIYSLHYITFNILKNIRNIFSIITQLHSVYSDKSGFKKLETGFGGVLTFEYGYIPLTNIF